MKMKYFVLFFVALGLVGCGTSQPTVEPTLPATVTPTPTLTSTVSTPVQPTTDASPTFDWTAEALANPSPIPTGTPIVDADGNVTWHPQKELISWSESGGDGVYYHYNRFTLFWNGMLLQPGNIDDSGLPYMIQLSQDEVCKILNTVEASGFFEEHGYYNFPFDGLGGNSISVNAWKSSLSGAQILDAAISGRPYYDTLFCRNCPIPSTQTVIQPGLANAYYFLQNYRSPTSKKVTVNEILVEASPVEMESAPSWPLTSMSLEQFIELMKKCQEDQTCGYEGMTFNGKVAQEIMEKIGNGGRFEGTFLGSPSIAIFYQPKVPDMPSDYTLTCNANAGKYPILPLNTDNKFWYYAPGGKWGAEVVAGENKIRVVNISGYEKFYGYDAAFFGQKSIQFYPRYWSADNRFFYVNVLPEDYEPDTADFDSIGLQQIDVANEKIKYMFLGSAGQTFAYQFSHKGNEIAYIRQGDEALKLVLVDAYSGQEQSVSLTTPEGIPYSWAGTLFWSPKDDKIFISAKYIDQKVEKGHILSVHLDKPTDLHIIKQSDHPFEMYDDFSDEYVKICSADDCSSLYLNTEEVK